MAIKVNIDAGHGSFTAGKRSCPLTQDVDVYGDGSLIVKKGEQFREHYANTMVANYLENILRNCGFTVCRTGYDDENYKDDIDTALNTRIKQIRANNCQYSISIHFNAYGDCVNFNTGRGIAVYYHSSSVKAKNSKTLATKVQSSLVSATGLKNRGVATAAFAMCNAYAMGTTASILAELCFMTNEYECHNCFCKADYWMKCAEAIAKALCSVTGVTYKDSGNTIELSGDNVVTTEKAVSSSKTSCLGTGDIGTDVTTLQKNLNTIIHAGLSVDGKFGSKTAAAVKLFQKVFGLTVDGLVGSVTQAKIKSLLSNLNYKLYKTDTVIKKSCKGTYAYLTQIALNKTIAAGLDVDGVVGDLTVSAIKKFQKKYSLDQDGKVGPKTKEKFKTLGY